MKKHLFTLLLLALTLSVSAGIPTGYYTDAEGKTGDDLKSSLHGIIDGHTQLSYDDVWTALMYTDEDPDNTDNVILLYSGWSYPKTNKGGGITEWNREHTWAKSQGNFGTSKGAGTDIHHLRPTDVTVNSARSSFKFDEGGTLYTDASRYGGGSGATECKKGSNNWEPADDVKGDVARMLFYMATRYEAVDGVDLELAESSSTSGNHGKLSILLEWHQEDPVSAWEIRRNDRAQEKQGNRNPFIDHPEYVCSIWGGDCDGVVTPPQDTTIVDPTPDPVVPVDGNYKLTFDNDLDGCTAYQVSGSTNWTRSIHDNDAYLYINTYESSASESWVLTPSVNFDTLENEVFSFDVSSYNDNKTIIDCGEGQFEVYYSTTHTGSTIDASQWTRFTAVDDVMLGDRWSFVNVTLDVSAIDGDNVTFAFVHKSSASNGTTWEVDNVTLTSAFFTNIIDKENAAVVLYPNPANANISFAKAYSSVEICSLSGQVIRRFSGVERGEFLDIASLNPGVYLVNTRDLDKIETVKLIKK